MTPGRESFNIGLSETFGFKCSKIHLAPRAPELDLVRPGDPRRRTRVRADPSSSRRRFPLVAMASNEVEEAMKRINSHKGVLGVLIVNKDGIPIKTTLEPAETVQHAALVTHFAKKTGDVIKALDPENELTFVRVRSKKHEILIAPDVEYTLVVLQHPQQ